VVQRRQGREDLFVHYSDVPGDGRRSLEEGAKVSFDARAEDNGPRAVSVTTP
jgi:CspA family cold shock protein